MKKMPYVSLLAALVLLLAIPVGLYVLQKPTETQSLASEGVHEDANADGKVNLQDAAFIREAMSQNRYVKRADLNQDGAINEKDVEKFYDLYSL